jgi:hypothetical protein
MHLFDAEIMIQRSGLPYIWKKIASTTFNILHHWPYMSIHVPLASLSQKTSKEKKDKKKSRLATTRCHTPTAVVCRDRPALSLASLALLG